MAGAGRGDRVWLIVCGRGSGAGRRTPPDPRLADHRAVVRGRPDAVLVVSPALAPPPGPVLVGWGRTTGTGLHWTEPPLRIDGLAGATRRTAVLAWLATARDTGSCPRRVRVRRRVRCR